MNYQRFYCSFRSFLISYTFPKNKEEKRKCFYTAGIPCKKQWNKWAVQEKRGFMPEFLAGNKVGLCKPYNFAGFFICSVRKFYLTDKTTPKQNATNTPICNWGLSTLLYRT
jgi:hypothetical protein